VFAVIRKIGITGGIASGKSRVAKILAGKLNCVHINADEVCRQLLQPHAEGWRKFSRVFGGKYLVEDGRINRPLLRKELFADEKFRQEVNNVIHPLVKSTIRVQMNNIIESKADSKVLVEVPLLYEVQWENLFDAVVVVYADYETCLNRLVERDGIERGAAIKELESQLDLAEKVIKADYVINNSGILADTNNQVSHLAELLKNNGKEEEKKLDS
jgi:dephospho-CoA kinase